MARTLEWQVRLELAEEDGTTRARATVEAEGTTFTGHGTARRNPDDPDVPVIGDELAASRAMSDLARQLMRAAYRDIGEVGAGLPGTERYEDVGGYGWSAVSA
ncbi:DUF1876 domain-containing protein [Streptomyces sp. NPDC093595]|jgi:hypothetical protein|uniref:DUF1876 domain-containing protein n=1 Tax=unclassified Streptomyces TaxID=2593676 RepID=UPI0037B4B193